MMLCRLFPGSITPQNVWDLTLSQWEQFKVYVDTYIREGSDV